MKLSIVSPVFKAENLVDELVMRLQLSVEKITKDYEIILVEDGGDDHSWEKIDLHCRRDSHVKGIKLSRNFGQHHAITAGLEYSTGDWVVVMDCDLQDSPEEIINLFNKTFEGFEVVVGVREQRKDNLFRKFESSFFNKVLFYFSGLKINKNIGNFGIYSKNVINNYLKIKEDYRSFGMFIIWLGFKRIEIPVEHSKRLNGPSSYSYYKKLRLAFDTILSNSDRALKGVIIIGLFISLISLLFTLNLVFKSLTESHPIIGWSSLILSIYFSLGLLMVSIGIVGLYVGKIFIQVKKRPLYVIEKIINYEEA